MAHRTAVGERGRRRWFAGVVLAGVTAAAVVAGVAGASHGGSWHVAERVSVASDESQFEDPPFVGSRMPSVSADGRFVAFQADRSFPTQVLVRDRQAGTTE